MSYGDVITVKKLTVADKAKIEKIEVDTEILPRVDNTVDVGSSTKELKDVYVDGIANIDEARVDTARINTGGTFRPETDDNADLGSPTNEFKDAYIDGIGYVDDLRVEVASRFTYAVSAAYDPPSIADGAQATTTVTVTGAALGDFVLASFSLSLAGVIMTAYVSAADTVTILLQNETGAAVDLAAGTLKVVLIKAA